MKRRNLLKHGLAVLAGSFAISKVPTAAASGILPEINTRSTRGTPKEKMVNVWLCESSLDGREVGTVGEHCMIVFVPPKELSYLVAVWGHYPGGPSFPLASTKGWDRYLNTGLHTKEGLMVFWRD